MIKHSYLTAKVKVFSSAINRKGVFAVSPIKKDEIIAVWGGYVITQKEFSRLLKTDFKNIQDYATKIAEGFYLVSCKKGRLEEDDFFNHSCNPNAGMRGQIIIAAMRNIAAKEEITYDYAMTDADFDYSFSCNCLAENCRKLITAGDWKNPYLQRKYKGYFSWYVQQKIQELKSSKRALIKN